MTRRVNNDRELRRRFAELRGVDESNTPSFAALLRASRDSRVNKSIPGRGSRIFLSACAVAAIVTAIWLNREDSNSSPNQDIVDWRPRSDALLSAARQTLLTEIPSLSASVLDTILR